jgi:hypothetical protein
MQDLGEALCLVVLVGLICALVFLFKGDPDVWDVMHAKAMQSATPSHPSPAPDQGETP